MGRPTRRTVLRAGGLVAGGVVVLGGGAVLANGEHRPRSKPDSAPVTEVTADIDGSKQTVTEITTTETSTPERAERRALTDSPGVTVESARQRGSDFDADEVTAAAPSPFLDDADNSQVGSRNADAANPIEFDLNEWVLVGRNRTSETDSHGNETGWTVEWRRDPNDPTRQGIKVELHMITGGYANDAAQITLDFDPERTNVERYLPGNAEIPGLDMDDRTDFVEETVVQMYDVGTEFADNTVRLAAAATTTTDPEPGATFVDVGVRSFYADSLLGTFVTDRAEISTYYRYSWA